MNFSALSDIRKGKIPSNRPIFVLDADGSLLMQTSPHPRVDRLKGLKEAIESDKSDSIFDEELKRLIATRRRSHPWENEKVAELEVLRFCWVDLLWRPLHGKVVKKHPNNPYI